MTQSVIQPWVTALPLRMQSTMLLSLRGPDGCSKENVAKILLRQLRSAVLVPAFPGTPDSFMGDQRGYVEWSVAKWFIDNHDEYPHHWIMHFVHAAEIVGQFHPDATIRAFWQEVYVEMASGFHMLPENGYELRHRLKDKDDD